METGRALGLRPGYVSPRFWLPTVGCLSLNTLAAAAEAGFPGSAFRTEFAQGQPLPQGEAESAGGTQTKKAASAPELPTNAGSPAEAAADTLTPDAARATGGERPVRQGALVKKAGEPRLEEGEQATEPTMGGQRQFLPGVVNSSSKRALQMAGTGLRTFDVSDPAASTRWYHGRFQSDPLWRAAEFNAVPLAETLLDGVGGNPAGAGIDLLGPTVPPGARVFRLGPISVSGAVNLAADYQHFDGDLGGAGGRSFSLNSSSASSGKGGKTDEYGFNTGAAFNFTIGEPATGHFMAVAYTFAFAGRTGETVDKPFTQSLAVLGRLDFAKLKLGAGVSFASLSGVSRDVGQEADRDLLGISLNASYPLTAKTQLDWDLQLPIRKVEGGIDSTSFRTNQVLSFQFDPKLTLGLGYGYGIEDDRLSSSARVSSQVSNLANRSQTFHRVFSRFNYTPNRKLSFSGDLGGEWRDNGSEDSLQPLMDCAVTWSPRETTTIGVGLQQSFAASSALVGQDYASTSVQVTANQQLTARLSALLGIGFEYADYQKSKSVDSGTRVDELLTIQCGLSYLLSDRWSASLSYVFADNSSTQEQFAFTASRVQIATSLAF